MSQWERLGEGAQLTQQFRQLGTLLRNGIFHPGGDAIDHGTMNKGIFFQLAQPVGEDVIADELQVLFDGRETGMSFFNAEQRFAQPPLADEIQQLVQLALLFQVGLVEVVGRIQFSFCHH